MVNYSLVRFVPDPVRGERVNLGVVVVADGELCSRARILPRFWQRITMLDPGADEVALGQMLDTIRRRFDGDHQQVPGGGCDERIVTLAGLQSLRRFMANQLQLSEPKPYRAASIDVAMVELYDDLVIPPARVQQQQVHMTISQIRDLIKNSSR